MARPRNRLVAWWSLLAIFFAQMATAVYACPLDDAKAAATPMGEMSTPCPDMQGTPADSPTALCIEHCKAGEQLVDTHPPAGDVASLPMLVFLVAPVHDDVVAQRTSIEPPLARTTSPPVLASSHRLRL